MDAVALDILRTFIMPQGTYLTMVFIESFVVWLGNLI